MFTDHPELMDRIVAFLADRVGTGRAHRSSLVADYCSDARYQRPALNSATIASPSGLTQEPDAARVALLPHREPPVRQRHQGGSADFVADVGGPLQHQATLLSHDPEGTAPQGLSLRYRPGKARPFLRQLSGSGPSYRSASEPGRPMERFDHLPVGVAPEREHEPVQRGMGNQEHIADLPVQRVALQPDRQGAEREPQTIVLGLDLHASGRRRPCSSPRSRRPLGSRWARAAPTPREAVARPARPRTTSTACRKT